MTDPADFARAMAQWQASLPTANKPTYVCGFLPDVNFQSMKMPSPNIFESKVVRAGRGSRPSEFLAALGFTREKINEGFVEAKKNAPPAGDPQILYNGDVPRGTPLTKQRP